MLGASQDGWVVPLVAAQSPDVAFIILKPASALPTWENNLYEVDNTLRLAGFPESVVGEPTEPEPCSTPWCAPTEARVPGQNSATRCWAFLASLAARNSTTSNWPATSTFIASIPAAPLVRQR